MTQVTQLPLGKVLAKIQTGSTPSTTHPEFFRGEIMWFTPGDIGNTKELIKSSRTISDLALSDGKAKLINKDSLLVTCIGEIGRVGLIRKPASSNQQITALSFKTDINVSYAYYWFLANRKQLEQRATHAVVPILNNSRLQEIEFEYPPLPEQQRIAAILEKADRLRRLRRYALELGDTYLQSVFLEMFGDPVTNPMGWEVLRLRSIAVKFSDGPFGSNLKTEHYTPAGVRVIRLQNIGVGQLIDEDRAYISENHFERLIKHRCTPGDVIVGTLGDPNLRATIQPDTIPFALNKADCVQIRPDPKKADPYFICWLLNLPHTLFIARKLIHGQTRTRISMGQLAQLEVPIPPLRVQKQFSRIVQEYERLRNQQYEALRQAEHLFQSLLHRAFQGELLG